MTHITYTTHIIYITHIAYITHITYITHILTFNFLKLIKNTFHIFFQYIKIIKKNY